MLSILFGQSPHCIRTSKSWTSLVRPASGQHGMIILWFVLNQHNPTRNSAATPDLCLASFETVKLHETTRRGHPCQEQANTRHRVRTPFLSFIHADYEQGTTELLVGSQTAMKVAVPIATVPRSL